MRYDFQSGLDLIFQRLYKIEEIIILVISGFTCSGKTYLAQQLETRLKQAGLNVSLVPLDNFFRDYDDSDFPTNKQGQLLFDVPAAFAAAEYLQAVLALAKGQSVWLPKYEMAINKRISSQGILVNPSPRIITEGLFTMQFLQGQHPNLLKVFVEADLVNTCLPRRIIRDTQLYGVSAETVRRVFLNKVVPANLESVALQKEMADIIITNDKGGG